MATIDIKSTTSLPRKKTLVIDTNVLMWIYGGYPIPPKIMWRVRAYSSFLSKAATNGCVLGTTVANVQEILHLIEKNEYEIISSSFPTRYKTLKDFRRDSLERAKLKTKVDALLKVLKSNLQIFDISMNKSILDSFVTQYHSHSYDPIDFFVVENQICSSNAFVTNDSDYFFDSRIDVYTVV